ncbi:MULTISPECIES: DUF7415 domain-containing protein [Enterobacter cloacae complex]|uniref:DUF7415 domain-containing protein n=1 Tax=Enterobacter cloacae complex TaxID=354276 RepID=UPI001C5AF191|nr:hypothetical protein [Enterobacter cloacae]MBW4229794.1 hypothetical protein [Enterobacter cloacae subsp. cloacae]MCK6973204.1 hypothetical protein [Enterobacter cloacae]MCU8696329.1 hypothetical protein [Enterobacter cloacae]MDQ1757208.1 hypothetical protein [Enterobacter cloacae]HCR0605014.1 hypothetical protein [Enterobacter cloacae]
MKLKQLVVCEIVDFFAGLGHPGEPETPEEMQRQLLARIEGVFTSQSAQPWTMLVTPDCPAVPPGREMVGGYNWLDWNQLSALGLIFRLNHEILHPMGLAIFRDPDTGVSEGALVAPDDVFTYPQYMIDEVYKGQA